MASRSACRASPSPRSTAAAASASSSCRRARGEGRALLVAPYFSSAVLGAYAILDSGDEDRPRPSCCPASPTAAARDARLHRGQWLGHRGAAPAGACPTATAGAHRSQVVRRSTATSPTCCWWRRGRRTALSLFAVDGNARGLARTELETLDQTRKLARVDFDGTPARLVGGVGGGERVAGPTLDKAAVALAAEQVGGAQRVPGHGGRVREGARTSSAARSASFQAIKHKCADMLMRVESARSAAYYARLGGGRGPDELPARRSWPRRTARTRTSTPRPRTSRSTAASASPGSTTRTCTSSGRSRVSSSSATRRSTGSGCSRGSALRQVTTEAPAPPATGRTEAAELRYAWRVLSLVCLAALMSGLNNSSINIALPTIVRHFNARRSRRSGCCCRSCSPTPC